MSYSPRWDQQSYCPPPYDQDEPDHIKDCACYGCREDRDLAEVNEQARAAAIDAGELCPECGAIDIKPGITGPKLAAPLFECRECGTLWFDCVTRPTLEAA